MKTISIVIPIYFNQDSLETLFGRLISLEKELKLRNFWMELIFVDDGSKDNSFNQILKFKSNRKNTKIIKLTRNFGANYAVKEGLKHIKGDCFTTLAADLQDPPENILKMIEKWEKGSKFIVCVRKSRDDGFLKNFFSRIFYFFLRKFVMNNYPKYGYDMALLDRSLLKHIINSAKSMFYSVHLYWLGYKPDMIFYKRQKRIDGKSKWTYYKLINSFLDVLLGFTPKFTQTLTFIGFLISFLSFIYGIFIIITALNGNIPVPGYATIIVLSSFFFGMVILYLSIVQEYLWRIYDELNKRSEVIIDEIYD